jgi:hypothetical protein
MSAVGIVSYVAGELVICAGDGLFQDWDCRHLAEASFIHSGCAVGALIPAGIRIRVHQVKTANGLWNLHLSLRILGEILRLRCYPTCVGDRLANAGPRITCPHAMTNFSIRNWNGFMTRAWGFGLNRAGGKFSESDRAEVRSTS